MYQTMSPAAYMRALVAGAQVETQQQHEPTDLQIKQADKEASRV